MLTSVVTRSTRAITYCACVSGPTDDLHHAAALLDAARVASSPAEVDRMLNEARAICARFIGEIDALRKPIAQLGEVLPRRPRCIIMLVPTPAPSEPDSLTG